MKRWIAVLAVLLLCVTMTACKKETSDGTKEELLAILADVETLPVGTMGSSMIATEKAAKLLTWCEGTAMDEAQAVQTLKEYIATFQDEDRYALFYEQMYSVTSRCKKLQDKDTRATLLDEIGLKASAYEWSDKAFALAGAIGDSMELPVFATETFEADVLEVYTVSLLVSPLEGEDERACCDKIAVSGADLPDGVKVGDRVRVTYSGEIAESYPAQLNTATLIEIVVSE